jgi:hypothetical protein
LNDLLGRLFSDDEPKPLLELNGALAVLQLGEGLPCLIVQKSAAKATKLLHARFDTCVGVNKLSDLFVCLPDQRHPGEILGRFNRILESTA